MMRAIKQCKVDEKFILDRCASCKLECKIQVTSSAKDYTVYCSATGLKEKAHELGLAFIEIPLGPGPVEVTI